MTIPFPMPTFPSPTAAMPVDSVAFNARGNDNQLIAGLNQVQASIAALGHTLTFGPHLQAAGTSYNGSANVTIATDATSANTVSTIVARDSSGNFSANTVTLAGTLTMTTAVSKIIPGATSFNVMDTTGARANFNVPNAGGMISNCATGEIPALSFTGTNGDMPAGAIVLNTGLVTGHRAFSIFANDGTAGITVGAYYYTQSAVETVWVYANAIGKAQGSTAFQFYPKGGEVSFGQNYAASGNTRAFIRMYGTTTTNLGGSATLIVQQGGISTDTLSASALISANGGLTVASGQTLTLTGATIVGLTFPSVGGSISYAQLPSGSGTWNTGALQTVTMNGNLSVAGNLIPGNIGPGAIGVSGQLNFTNATAAFTIQPGGSVLSVVGTSQTGVASVTIPDFAGVNDTFAFLTLPQTLSNKTLDGTCVVPASTLTGNLAYAALPTGNGTWDTGAGTTLTVAQSMTVNGNFQVSTGALATIITASTGLVAIGGSFHLNGTYTTTAIIQIASTVTNASGFGRIFFGAPTMVAAANNDIFFGVSMAPAFTPGSFTGLGVISFSISSFSVASFVSPADPIMLSFGQITGTGATNAYAIKLGAGPTGATNNYLIHATNFNLTSAGRLTSTGLQSSGAVLSSSATAGSGYSTGAGGTVTQLTSRTTGVTLSKPCGAITLFTAAGTTAFTTFTVTNTLVAATDVIELSVKSSTNVYLAKVTAVASGSFNITFWTTGGTSSDAPVINFALKKVVTS